MDVRPNEFLRTDFGREVYDKQKHYGCDFSNKHLPPDELKNCLVEVGFTDSHFYKKRRLEGFHPENDNGFSVVATK